MDSFFCLLNSKQKISKTQALRHAAVNRVFIEAPRLLGCRKVVESSALFTMSSFTASTDTVTRGSCTPRSQKFGSLPGGIPVTTSPRSWMKSKSFKPGTKKQSRNSAVHVHLLQRGLFSRKRFLTPLLSRLTPEIAKSLNRAT